MKILLVEDEHRIANAIKKGLELEHYTVDVVYDGSSGFDLATTADYDLLILDLMLPQLDGLSVCKNLRKQNVHTPILILTAKGQTKDKVDGLNSGADDYLTKPFSFEELLARIKALLRRPQKTEDVLLKIADLTLDTNSFTLKRGIKNIQLSNREFFILEYLMRNPSKILTKEQIINHVWDYETNILPNTVEVFIRNLRSKIEKPFPDKPPLIFTVRGFGYKIGN